MTAVSLYFFLLHTTVALTATLVCAVYLLRLSVISAVLPAVAVITGFFAFANGVSSSP